MIDCFKNKNSYFDMKHAILKEAIEKTKFFARI